MEESGKPKAVNNYSLQTTRLMNYYYNNRYSQAGADAVKPALMSSNKVPLQSTLTWALV